MSAEYDSPIPRFAVCGPLGNFLNGISPSDSCVLARTTTGHSNVCGILHGVPRKEIPMPPECAHGTCSGGPTLGESGYGIVGHVDHVREGESLHASDGGLFLSVDGGLSVAGQDRHFGGGCFLQ